jgi:hypothetical protein
MHLVDGCSKTILLTAIIITLRVTSPAMQLPPGTEELMAGTTRIENKGRDSGATQQTFNHSTVRDNARAHFGNSYYYGTVYQNSTPVAPLTGDTEHKITEKLKFDSMDMRRATVKLPSGNTCRWFFNSPEYEKWRDVSMFVEHNGFLWIRGKPGAGKSTLMRLAVKYADQEFPNDLRISFFFNAKGTPLEKSVEGMYRTLLYQLLVQCPELEKVFHKRPWNHPTWPVEILEEHFRDCVLQLGARKLTCHIDALDECEESDVRSLVEFFEDFGSTTVSAGVQMHVCFASRHYPRVSISQCVHLVLDNLKGHQEDIATYVRNNLKVSELARRNQFAEDIRERARDVFLWVVLVVRLLNKESDQGNSHNLQAQLDAIPSGLHDLFEDAIIERGTGDSRYLLPTLLWVLFATRPLTPSELYHAVLNTWSDSDDAVIFDHTPGPSQIEKFIINTSKGLAEITVSMYEDGQRVQFIHETVREHFQNSGISRLEKSFCNNPTGMSHDFLKSRCADYISHAASYIPRFELLAPSDWRSYKGRLADISDRFPFLSYAAGVDVPGEGLVAHAELAQVHGVSQVAFLDAFPRHLMIKLRNFFDPEGEDEDEYYPSATKSYIFAALNAPRLLQLELDRLEGSGEHRSRVDAGVVSTTDVGDVLNSVQGDRGTPLHVAIHNGRFRISKLLLERGSDVNARGGILGTALEIVTMNDYPNMHIVELLFQYGADINARSGSETVLELAVLASNMNMALVRLFSKHSVDQWESNGSALQKACLGGRLDVVQCLVEHGANVNAKGAKDGFGTALQVARRSPGKQKIVHYLIEQGARES